MMYKETTCRPIWVKSGCNEIKCQTGNPEQAQDFSLCLKKWHISYKMTIKERTLGCFSKNVKKLKPILTSLVIVMFSLQNTTGITGWGKWVIPGLDPVLGSWKDDEFGYSSEKRAASSSPFHLCNAQIKNKSLFLHYLPRKLVDAFLFRLPCSSLFTSQRLDNSVGIQ